VNLTAFVRTLDSAGTFELADVTVGPNGQGIARADRTAYLDADELVHMIRMAVREELAVFQLSIRKSEQQ
jgi:hypothetical protein